MFFLSTLTLALISFSSLAGDPYAARSNAVVGQTAFSFHAKTIYGKAINFPDDYKGKVVLLDFWATWCPPCRRELPHVVAAYNKYHDKGFEIVSVSLDEPRVGPQLLQFLKDNNMTWDQIYDGLYWKAEIAVQYGVHSIPCPVLVDGDTRKIIATDVGTLGSNLTNALEIALAGKAKK